MVFLFLIISGFGFSACSSEPTSIDSSQVNTSSVNAVAGDISGNPFGITKSDLKSKKNPNGIGDFVYVEETRFDGVERFLIWLVVNEQAHPLNSPSKETTPDLPWLREADETVLDSIGISPYQATEAIEIVFGEQ